MSDHHQRGARGRKSAHEDFQTLADIDELAETPRITIQPLRSASGSLQYHIDIRLAGSDTIVLATSLDRVLPVTFEHIQDLVESGLVRPPLPPYHIIFERELPADGVNAPRPIVTEERVLLMQLDSHKNEWVAELRQCLGPWVEWLPNRELSAINRAIERTATVEEFAQILSPCQRGYIISAPEGVTRDDDDLNELFAMEDVGQAPVERKHLAQLKAYMRTFRWNEVAIEE